MKWHKPSLVLHTVLSRCLRLSILGSIFWRLFRYYLKHYATHSDFFVVILDKSEEPPDDIVSISFLAFLLDSLPRLHRDRSRFVRIS